MPGSGWLVKANGQLEDSTCYHCIEIMIDSGIEFYTLRPCLGCLKPCQGANKGGVSSASICISVRKFYNDWME